MTIKQMRVDAGLTQVKCAEYLNIPLRTYKRYEADDSRVNAIKLEFIKNMLLKHNFIDEEHGILSIEQIKKICEEIFKQYPVDYCYLFGSYAKGKAKETSDVDLLISMPTNGLMYFELVELLREKLRKKVDLLDINQLSNNDLLTREILKDGVKIYG